MGLVWAEAANYTLIVFAGPVDWTEKMTKTKPNATTKDWTTGCSCTNPETFQLPVTRFDVI